jgi:hypothetical protein
MDVVGVPMGSVASACKVVRLREGQTLRGIVGKPAVGVLVHWAQGKSQLCVDPLGRDSCPHCRGGDAPQWQAFVPVRHVVSKGDESVEVASLLLLGSRSVASGGLRNLEDLVGREVEFRRGRKRRFVEIQVMLESEAFDHPVCQNLCVLFGAGRFWAEAGTDAYRNLMESVNRMYQVERVRSGS